MADISINLEYLGYYQGWNFGLSARRETKKKEIFPFKPEQYRYRIVEHARNGLYRFFIEKNNKYLDLANSNPIAVVKSDMRRNIRIIRGVNCAVLRLEDKVMKLKWDDIKMDCNNPLPYQPKPDYLPKKKK